MKQRTPMKRKTPLRPSRQRQDGPAAAKAKPLRQSRRDGADMEREPKPWAKAAPRASVKASYGGSTRGPVPKATAHRSKKLRDSARGEPCLVVIPGCQQDAEQTIWSHYRGSAGGKAGARKADDICGAYACTYCDAVYDGQRPRPAGLTKDDVDRLWLEGHIRSLVRVHEKGLLS